MDADKIIPREVELALEIVRSVKESTIPKENALRSRAVEILSEYLGVEKPPNV